ncbi:ABC transporter substrate-binding protein [Pectinatus frisingensis]|uniref:ABC transporter substrate-binding protein n=1 Tax=Pectinatus frisingensis TaxID=865 RepID=UPI001E41D4A7|nr:extracellular solute-binding protein [Pectinatus frisingensis]
MNKFKILAMFALIFAFICFSYYAYTKRQKQIIIHLGIFTGSNWNVPAGDPYAVVDNAISNFEKTHPNVKIIYVNGIRKQDYAEWLSEQVLKDNEPDVFMVLSDDFNLYSSIGLLQNLDDFINNDTDFSSNAYYKPALDYGKYKFQQYALPFESVPTLMFVNKTLLEHEGIPIPNNNWTWQDFLDICRAVTKDTNNDGQIDQFGCYDYTWQQAAISNNLQLFKEDGTFSHFADNKMKETLQFMIELRQINHGCIVTAKDFDMGKVAFRPFTFAEYQTYKPYPWRIKKYSSFEWDCIKMPAGPSGTNISQLDTLLIGISSRSKQKTLAWEFLKKLCYDSETQKLLLSNSQGVPVIKSVVESNEAGQDLMRDAPGDEKMNISTISNVMETAISPPKFKKYSLSMLIADNEIKKIIDGTIPLNNALNKVQKKVNDFLQN